MKTLLLDFDGVIHSYVSGWQGATIPDDPVPGAFDFIRALLDDGRFKVCIWSSRTSGQEGGCAAMHQWFRDHGLAPEHLDGLWFPIRKLPAFLTIDDRAICFTGEFPSLDAIAEFQPWYKQPKEDTE